jgi:formylglycine-generating enzyme required for sulfatase activity
MPARTYRWRAGDGEHELRLVPVSGTSGRPYPFGSKATWRAMEIREFHCMTTPVTQALWTHVMGSNPSQRDEPRRPVTNVSWDGVAEQGGFLDRINAGEILAAVAGADRTLRLRLPSEAEWESAARGGPRWTDGFAFSGSDDVDRVAWYGCRFSRTRRLVCRILGWRLGWRLAGRRRLRAPTHPHDVATKAPNQLGLYDMCGNVWEWCDDTCVDDIRAVPRDGSPWLGSSEDRRLRGGCHDNWDIHCTVWFRYGIVHDAHGFRMVLAPERRPPPLARSSAS